MFRPRTILVGATALALALALAPLLPRDHDRAPKAQLSGEPTALAATAGAGRVTEAMRAEIERVVGGGRTLSRGTTKNNPAQLVRCAVFEGQRYCLGVGWTQDTEAEVQARVLQASRTRSTKVETTGDLDAFATLQRASEMPPTARAEAERRELTEAARSVAKVWLLRSDIQGVPLPANFWTQHPEARAAGNEDARPFDSFPAKAIVMDPEKTTEQRRTYWCGPTTMQMIAWNWKFKNHSQAFWAKKLHTTSAGTSITDMVRVVNETTGWDKERRAGTYVVLDISDLNFRQWLKLNARHFADYRAPIVYHPILLKQFYPYLDDDASGHFQAGRGYLKRKGKPTYVSYFEPWNQQRFDPSEPYIPRVQWRNAFKSYRANVAHSMHNIGV